MTNRETLRSLADAVEALSGPCRETDGWIYAHMTRSDPYIIGNEPGRFPAKPIYGERLDVMEQVGGKDAADYINAPPYTASIDSAMSLVPAGYRVMLSEWDDEAHLRPRGAWQAVLSMAGSGMFGFNGAFKTRCEHGATPALALTAASLRAIGEGL